MTAAIEQQLTDDQKKSLPCFQNPGPWQDTNSLPLQKWAARQCQTRCAFQRWCDGQRRSTLAEFKTATGVWAGQIFSHRDQEDRISHSVDRSSPGVSPSDG